MENDYGVIASLPPRERFAITALTNSSTAFPCSAHASSDWKLHTYPPCCQSCNGTDDRSCSSESPPQWIAAGGMLTLQTAPR